MNTNDLLSIRERERNLLLDRITKILERDQRVIAAWLSGSLSRGDGDGLSDIDLHIVVTDESIRDFIENRRAYAGLSTQPVLFLEAMQNAPPGGAYLLALYPGEIGPQHVDWFWQPHSNSQRPDDVDPIFDRVGLPVTSGEQW